MSDASFKDFVLDQLQHLDDLTCRRMFGGYGLYQHGVFSGIIAHSRLYFKTNAATRTAYSQRGMQPFRPNPKQTLNAYYEVPVDVLEDDAQLTLYAQQAVACQLADSTAE
jgi:DNA transformation protein